MKKLKQYTAQQFRINAFMSHLPYIISCEKRTSKRTGEPLIFIQTHLKEDIIIRFKNESARNNAYNEFTTESNNYKQLIKNKYGISNSVNR